MPEPSHALRVTPMPSSVPGPGSRGGPDLLQHCRMTLQVKHAVRLPWRCPGPQEMGPDGTGKGEDRAPSSQEERTSWVTSVLGKHSSHAAHASPWGTPLTSLLTRSKAQSPGQGQDRGQGDAPHAQGWCPPHWRRASPHAALGSTQRRPGTAHCGTAGTGPPSLLPGKPAAAQALDTHSGSRGWATRLCLALWGPASVTGQRCPLARRYPVLDPACPPHL